jgi:hypothetical protein
MGTPLTTPISKMLGRYWLHFSDLTNRKETPAFSPAGPHIRSGLLETPHLFKNPASGLNHSDS